MEVNVVRANVVMLEAQFFAMEAELQKLTPTIKIEGSGENMAYPPPGLCFYGGTTIVDTN